MIKLSWFKQIDIKSWFKQRDIKKLWIDLSLSIKHTSDKKYTTIFNALSIGVPLIAGCSFFAFNTVGLNRYKKVVVMHPETPIDPKLETLAFDVWTNANLPQKYKQSDMIQFFHVIGDQTFSAGSIKTGFGAIIGLPYNWRYDTVSDIRRRDLLFMNEHNPFIKWDGEDAKQLLESLVVSDSAKKFAIAREIHLSNTFRVHVNTALIMASIVAGLYSARFIIRRYRSYRVLGLFRIRLMVRTFSLFATMYVAMILSYIIDYQRNLSIDRHAINERPEYMYGAVEYYEKMLAKNVALYALLGKVGKKMFTETGEMKGLKQCSINTRLKKIRKSIERQKQVES